MHKGVEEGGACAQQCYAASADRGLGFCMDARRGWRGQGARRHLRLHPALLVSPLLAPPNLLSHLHLLPPLSHDPSFQPNPMLTQAPALWLTSPHALLYGVCVAQVSVRQYKYFIFINCSVRGPYLPSYARVRRHHKAQPKMSSTMPCSLASLFLPIIPAYVSVATWSTHGVGWVGGDPYCAAAATPSPQSHSVPFPLAPHIHTLCSHSKPPHSNCLLSLQPLALTPCPHSIPSTPHFAVPPAQGVVHRTAPFLHCLTHDVKLQPLTLTPCPHSILSISQCATLLHRALCIGRSPSCGG